MPEEHDPLTGVRVDRFAPQGTPPAPGMPLRLLVLDAVADSPETVVTMRCCGDMEPDGIALVGEDVLLAELRALMADGLVEAVPDPRFGRTIGDARPTDDEALRHYWYSPTPAGWSALEEGDAALEAYWDARLSGRG